MGRSRYFLVCITLSLSAIGAFPSVAISQDRTCAELFSKYDPTMRPYEDPRFSWQKLDSVMAKLEQKQRTKFQRNSEACRQSGFSSYFDRVHRKITVNPEQDPIDQFIFAHHEAVHATTEFKLRTEPENPENALAVRVVREGEPIDSNLPILYQKLFQADEMKSYLRQAGLYAQVARERKAHGDQTYKILEELAEAVRRDSGLFAEATLRLNEKMKTALQGALRGEPLQIKYYRFTEETPSLLLVDVTFPQPSGPPIIVAFPLHEPGFKGGAIPDIHKRLLKICDDLEKTARLYVSEPVP